MKALEQTVKLPAGLDRWTDPDLDLRRVAAILPVGKRLLVAVHQSDGTRLYRVSESDRRLVLMDDVPPVSAAWPGDAEHVLASVEGAIWRVTPQGERSRLVDLPEEAVEVAAAWHRDAPVVACLVNRTAEPDPESPQILPDARPCLVLVRYTSSAGWVDLAEVPAGVRQLEMSDDGRRLVWVERVNVVPEEARRGELRAFDVDTGRLRYLTRNAGKLDSASISPDGSAVIYVANHQVKHPVTTHQDVWWVRWSGRGRKNLTGGGRCIEGFGWGAAPGEVWLSEVRGLELRSEVVSVAGKSSEVLAGPSLSAPPAWTSDGARAYEGEDGEDYPRLYIGRRKVTLPQPSAYRDFRIRRVEWEAEDGQDVQGVVYETLKTPPDAPLLVRVHGGPAGEVAALRSQAVRHRHLLKAGYRVFNPAFRGSLGFGDAFLRGNIRCQGEGDLDDILSGVGRLVKMRLAKADRVGIFGGSYGGYMTLRALAVTDRFTAGVASFGFTNNRWMTLETGDFTYEEEYVGPVRWPPTARSQRGNVFQHLGSVNNPLLLLHGDSDTICPVSQSVVAYRALEARGVPTGLVLYPGEGHGFRKKPNQRDAARRTLAWFLEHLPP